MELYGGINTGNLIYRLFLCIKKGEGNFPSPLKYQI